ESERGKLPAEANGKGPPVQATNSYTDGSAMKCRLHNTSERGMALVITLVMLAIVTVMAIIFLGVSRRERASVKIAEDIATANMMADAAAERAKAEAIAKMAAEGT